MNKYTLITKRNNSSVGDFEHRVYGTGLNTDLFFVKAKYIPTMRSENDRKMLGEYAKLNEKTLELNKECRVINIRFEI